MSFREQFDPVQWGTLQTAPFLILSGVSGRYRDFPAEDLAVFEFWLDSAARDGGHLTREVLSSVSADLELMATGFADYRGTIASGLTDVCDVLSGHPLSEGDDFRHALIHVLGGGIARARGPYGKEPTVEASQMLMMLDEFLRPGIRMGASA